MLSDKDAKLAEIAAAQHGVFTVNDARTVKLTDTQIDVRVGCHWIRLYEGVYRAAGAPQTWRGDLRAATLAAGDGSAISHRSGAALYRVPGGREDLIELTCPRGLRTVQRGIVVHESRRLDAQDIGLIDGIPVVSAERLVLDLASYRPVQTYLESVIHAARRKRLITYDSMRATFDRHARRGVKGVKVLRTILDEWNPGDRVTESEMETVLLQALRDHSLPEPVLQYQVLDARGAFVARTDAAYPSHRIVIEYDSKQEHSDEFQLSRDARRRNAIQALGFVVLSVRHAELVAGGGEFCAQIRAIIRRTA